MKKDPHYSEDGKIIVSIDPDLKDLIPDYLKNRHQDVEIIRQAIEQKDFPTIQSTGHTMKGSGGGYGFDFISAIGMVIEQAGKEHDAEKAKKSLEELIDYLNRVEPKFD